MSLLLVLFLSLGSIAALPVLVETHRAGTKAGPVMPVLRDYAAAAS